MSHEVYQSAVGAVLTYEEGDLPWHKLGTSVPVGTLPSEAAKLVRADEITVSTDALYRKRGDEFVAVEGQYELVRDPWAGDDKPLSLGIVSDKYEPIQNKWLFGLFDNLAKYANVSCVGVLRQGACSFMTFHGEGFEILLPGGKRDPHKMYLLVYEDKRPGNAVQFVLSPVRTVCMNTVRLAVDQQQFSLNISHEKGAGAMTEWVAATLSKIASAQRAVTQAMQQMADTPVTEEQVSKLIAYALPLPPKPSKVRLGEQYFAGLMTEGQVLALPEVDQSRFADFKKSEENWVAAAERTSILRSFAYSTYLDHPTEDGIRGTVHGAYNAVSFTADHYNMNGAKAATATLFGERASWKSRAAAYAMDLCLGRDN